MRTDNIFLDINNKSALKRRKKIRDCDMLMIFKNCHTACTSLREGVKKTRLLSGHVGAIRAIRGGGVKKSPQSVKNIFFVKCIFL